MTPDTVYRKLTYADYLLFPEDGNRHEILDGEHCLTPAPLLPHQRVSSRLHSRLGPFVLDNHLGELFAAPTDVVLSPRDVVQPDLVFVSNQRMSLLTKANIQGAPDLFIEILSDSTRRTDEGIKRDRYERFGVLEYWVADLAARAFRVYRRQDAGFLPFETFSVDAGDMLTTSLLPGLELSVREVFSQEEARRNLLNLPA